MRRQIYRKIDPDLMKPMRSMSKEKATVILHSHKGCRCREYVEKMGFKIKHELPLIDCYSVEAPYNKLEQLAALKQVKYIEADISVKTQMNIANEEVKVRRVHEAGYTGKGIGIAIIDTGIYPHIDFTRPKNRLKVFKDFVNEKKSPYDDNGHGTFIAGVATGSGYSSGGRYKGIAPDADIIVLKTMDEDGGGSASDILSAMQWVADHHEEYNIKVVSMSLGAEARRLYSDALVEGVEALWDKGLVVVVAAGNSGPDPKTITTPGISSKVITVGAADDKRTVDIKDDDIAEFSSRGPVGKRTKPDVVAPGVDIVSVKSEAEYKAGDWVRPMTEPYTTMSGTSVATPVVAGAAILMMQKYPDWKPDKVKEILMQNAVKIVNDANKGGRGIIDIEKSMGI